MLCYVVDMPLATLDLTNYIHITDTAMEHIGHMSTYVSLSLPDIYLTSLSLFVSVEKVVLVQSSWLDLDLELSLLETIRRVGMP